MQNNFRLKEDAYEDYEEREARIASSCGDLTEVHLRERFSLLEQALAGNIPGASARYFQEGPAGDPGALEQRPDDPFVVEWKKRVVIELERTGRLGDFEALSTLGTLYQFGVFGEGSLSRALEYEYALFALLKKADKPYRSQEALVESLRKRFSPEAATSAEARGRALADGVNGARQLGAG